MNAKENTQTIEENNADRISECINPAPDLVL